MNCKVGDRAIVYRYNDKEFSANLGKICDIISALDESAWVVHTLNSFYLYDTKLGWVYFPAGYNANVVDNVLWPMEKPNDEFIKRVPSVIRMK